MNFKRNNNKALGINYKQKAGFTLVELLLVIAAMAILAGASLPVYQSFQVRNYLDTSANDVVQTVRRARTLSQAVDGDSSWGVKIESGKITLFKGTSYSSRDAGYDELFDLPASITFSGMDEVVFNKLSGFPASFGAITLISSTNESRTININSKGIVEY